MHAALRATTRRRQQRILSSAALALRHASTSSSSAAAAQPGQKRAGDISDAFGSLSGQTFAPLTPYYASVKSQLIRGHEGAVRDSWVRLLRALREEVPRITALGSRAVPEVDFADVAAGCAPQTFRDAYRETGVAVVRGAIPERDMRDMKEDLKAYIRANPQTKGKLPNPLP